MNWWEAALLGLVQGLTEFLPVSSSGHLVLGKYLLGMNTDQAGIAFEVFVHFGTVLSILTVYWGRVFRILGEAFTFTNIKERYHNNQEYRFALFILITLIPTAIVYVFFGDQLEALFERPRFVCLMLLVTGTLLILTLLRRNPSGNVTPLKAFVIGIAQSAAMIPGISRSGSTICTALYQNVENKKAADFSFLMLLPVVIGATILQGLDLFDQGLDAGRLLPLFIGTLVAYVSGIAAIRAMIGLVSRGNMHYFAYYCFAIGTLGLIFI